MGKRSSFARAPRDFYPTPIEAVLPLFPHLEDMTRFCEPCAGDGTLVEALRSKGHVCVEAYDIEPQHPAVARYDALTHRAQRQPECFITNPPWSRDVLHPLITHLSSQAPAWLLFDADWMHTRQSAPYLPLLQKIVSVGRVKWIADSPFTGKDNCCWYLFDAKRPAATQFIGRAA